MLELIIAFVIGWILGWRINDAVRTTAMRHLLKELGITERDLRAAAARNGIPLADAPDTAADHTVVEVRLEQDGNQIFAYRKSDNQFLGQGQDSQGLIERLNQNLTPCRVVVSKEDGADLLQKSHT